MTRTPWLTVDHGDSIHVTPVDDLFDHTVSVHCGCGPRVEQYVRPLIIHASLDGRELVYG